MNESLRVGVAHGKVSFVLVCHKLCRCTYICARTINLLPINARLDHRWPDGSLAISKFVPDQRTLALAVYNFCFTQSQGIELRHIKPNCAQGYSRRVGAR